MSNFNVEKNSWLEVVFEGKNKAYGAYQLRQENDRTTLKALFIAVVLVATGLGLVSFSTTKYEEPIIHPCPKLEPSVVFVEPNKMKPKTEEQHGERNTKKNTRPSIHNTPRISDIATPKPEAIPGNEPFNPNGSENGKKPGTEGNPITLSSTISGGNGGGNSGGGSMNIVSEAASFPGGINKFREYVASNFKIPSDFNKEYVYIELSFIIETDGSISSIKMQNNGDEKLEKEAIRVLQSMKQKWEPGKSNGIAVRSEKMLPIKIMVTEIED